MNTKNTKILIFILVAIVILYYSGFLGKQVMIYQANKIRKNTPQASIQNQPVTEQPETKVNDCSGCGS